MGRFLGSGDGLLAQPGDKDCGSAASESYFLQRDGNDGRDGPDQTHHTFRVNLPSEVGGSRTFRTLEGCCFCSNMLKKAVSAWPRRCWHGNR